NDLNTAREIYLGKLTQVNDVVRFTGSRFFLRDALLSGNFDQATDELVRIKEEEGLDVLTVTDKYGYVLLRTGNLALSGDNQGHDKLIRTVLLYEDESVASTVIVSSEDLKMESPQLAEQAYFKYIDTPLALDREETEDTAGMMLKAAAPIVDEQHNLIGVVYGGVLLNRNYEIVDKVKQTVYNDFVYKGQDIGTATIFQDDVRISTNVKNEDGSRAIGTRVTEEVYNKVVNKGERWIDRAYVVNNWFITAYEPIYDAYNRIVGILYVGVLEQKYLDIRSQTILTFLAITLAGALFALVVAYYFAQRILVPINRLVTASKEVAQGNLDVKVNVATNDELQYLADSFNAMALSLKRREEQLREFTTQKIMESERLALIGQLSANVAHELNNPLTGIVTYSHLLLERIPLDDPNRNSISKIVVQANRSKDIIRGLLDFSRQRKPDMTVCDITSILKECVSLVEDQALFLNIKIRKEWDPNLPPGVVDPSQIERVFMNIIINAAEAMESSGLLTLTSRFDPVEQDIVIDIKDSGPGISEENLEKVFDPFFTTKDVGHGTGLGLAISYGIVTKHGGTLTLHSEEGKGTTFSIRLPVSAEPVKERQ
ncbi:MAG: cache domain-containing protein, partial [Anaerolineales bacterium]|nr:cache domain-containing protein [Anaerolineales bacterium]